MNTFHVIMMYFSNILTSPLSYFDVAVPAASAAGSVLTFQIFFEDDNFIYTNYPRQKSICIRVPGSSFLIHAIT